MLRVKKTISLLTGCALCLLASCGSPKNNAVSTIFIHKYGAALSENDWVQRGGHGKIITTQKDGVTICQNYVEHQLDGKTTYTFPYSNVVEKEESYRHGHLIAETLCYSSGTPKEKREFISHNELHLTKWYENGTPMCIEKFYNAKLQDGEYYNSNNEIESRVQLGNGVKTERNSFGEFISKIDYNNGSQALVTTFYSNGDPQSITPYQNNKVHGTVKYYLVNGIPDRTENWQNGVQQGLTSIYRDGELYSERPYVAGKKNGVEQIYDDQGQVACEISWKNDLKHGFLKSYIADTVQIEWYYRGSKVSHSDFEKFIVQQ